MDIISSAGMHNFSKADMPFHIWHRKHPTSAPHRSGVRYRGRPLTHQLLDEIPVSDTFAWNTLIHTHLSNRDVGAALSIFHHMLLRGVRPDRHTFPRVLTASRLSRNLRLGKQLHAQALKFGFLFDHYLTSSLIDMYGSLDCVAAAKWLFDKSSTRNPVSWTMLARLLLKEKQPNVAIDMFYQMVDSSVRIDSVAFATAIGACGMLKSVQKGKHIHDIAKQFGLEFDILVSNSLVKMYIDCDRIGDARDTFDQMPTKDVISWTEIITGYVKKGQFNEALKLFRQMNMEGIKPDSLSISSVLPACARTATHKVGKEIHGYLLRNEIDLNLTIQNAIVDMYVKSGFIEYATKVFGNMKDRDVVSWTVMILGFSLHGEGELGVELFRKMENDPRMEIDQFAYEAVLHSCTTARCVEEGKIFFNCIKEPKIAQYILMVSLLARAALFDEARTFIKKNQIERNGEVLRALLDAYRIHNQAKIGKRVIEQLCELEPLNAENYVLLSNWYASNAKWDMVSKLIETIKDMGLKPRKAYSWIEFRNKVHVFGTGDVSHPRSEKIYWELQCLMKEMEAEDQLPASDFSLHDVDEERECILIGHSELLAVSFGLISTQAGTTIRVAKNLRMCRGCHDSAKLISKMVQREIIIKDPYCFHHFKDGTCSCREFW